MDEQNIQIYTEPSNLDYVLIKTKESTVENEGLYDATRKAWHAKLSTAEPYKYALSVVSGIVREVYEVEKWQMFGEDRIGFEGHPAPNNITDWFKGKLIPEKYRVKGLASPFLYKRLLDGEETKPIALETPIYTEPSNPVPRKKIPVWVWIALALVIIAVVVILVLCI